MIATAPPPDRIECLRCGFTVNLEGASPKGRDRLSVLAAEHAAGCESAPGISERRAAKAAAREAAWEDLKERRANESAADRKVRRIARALRRARA